MSMECGSPLAGWIFWKTITHFNIYTIAGTLICHAPFQMHSSIWKTRGVMFETSHRRLDDVQLALQGRACETILYGKPKRTGTSDKNLGCTFRSHQKIILSTKERKSAEESQTHLTAGERQVTWSQCIFAVPVMTVFTKTEQALFSWHFLYMKLVFQAPRQTHELTDETWIVLKWLRA